MNIVVKNFIYNTGYQLLAIVIPIVTMPYLARVIGAEGMGQYSYAYSIAYYFVMFIMLGLNNYGNRTIAGVRNKKALLSKVFFEIYTMQFIMGLIASGCYVVYCLTIGKSSTFSWILGLYILSAIIDINWVFFGLEKFKFTVTRNTIIKIASTVAIFVFVKKEQDLVLYVIIIMISFLLSNIVLWPAVMKEVSWCKVSAKDIMKHVKPNLVLFIPIIAVSLYKYMDKIMLGSLSSMEQVGFYEYSEKIIQIPIAIVNSLAVVMLPRMSYLVANKKNNEEDKYITASIIVSMFLSTSLCFGLMGISKEFVPLFYGIKYLPCINLFYILLPSCCFIAFASVIRTQFLIPHKMDSIYIISVIIGAVVNVVVNLLLIPRFQAVGAAIGTLLAEAAVCFYQAFKIRCYIEIRRHFLNGLPFIASGIAMFLILLLLPVHVNSLILQICIKILVGVIAYLCLCLILVRFNHVEYKFIHGTFSKIKKRYG